LINRVEIQTASRLHFGLLGWGPGTSRQFGGVGLMVKHPGIGLTLERAETDSCRGVHSERALRVARDVVRRVGGPLVSQHFSVTVLHAPSEHVGLGTGTQLSLAVAKAVMCLIGRDDVHASELAGLCGRGLRSGIGIHGFDRGGLIVDGGHGASSAVPPLLAHRAMPLEWSILLAIPELPAGRHGSAELDAFRGAPTLADAQLDRMCRLVLLGILPAAAEADLPAFGEALTELQSLVGLMFAPAQGGGAFAHPMLEALAHKLRSAGFQGVGQSSWGPTLYAFTDRPAAEFSADLKVLEELFSLKPGALVWTGPSAQGAVRKVE
jgi:beta-RFAP synthase